MHLRIDVKSIWQENWFGGHTTLFTQISRPKENRRHVKHKVVYTSDAQEMFQCCYDNVAKFFI